MKINYSFKNIVLAGFLCVSITAGATRPVDVSKAFGKAEDLYERGMYDKALEEFSAIANVSDDDNARGYAVLCAENLRLPGYETLMDEYIQECPYSLLLPQMHYQYALNLFDDGEYSKAAVELDKIQRRELQKKQITAFVFKRAYCYFETGDYANARNLFEEVTEMKKSDFTAPSQYSLGYIAYEEKRFSDAIKWFEKSVKDTRFSSISEYYLLESHFMLKDYAYVVENAPSAFSRVPSERHAHLGRILSESYLVRGETEKARKYYDEYVLKEKPANRSDYFYAGTLLYEMEDYKGAVENYSKMTSRVDSLGQIANYQMASSYLKLKNKVAAMEAFRDASAVDHNAVMQEDAFFNYAKLSFDLNNDSAPFKSYLVKYSDKKRGEEVYNYIALAAINNHDYEAAIAAYDNLDLVDDDMKGNYMKANYLRASQLIADGSYRSAIPVLKTAAYYSDKRSVFNQLSRYWMGEAYYRSGDCESAENVFSELYNNMALYGRDEGSRLAYNIAWCRFKNEEYDAAAKWFSESILENNNDFLKDALERKGDCYFMMQDYAKAFESYNDVLSKFYDCNDIYPYYQAAICSGLDKKNQQKAEILENVYNASSDSKYWSDAMYELGRTYVDLKQNDRARSCFNRLQNDSPDSTFIAKALIEKAMISRNEKNDAAALEEYKQVLEKFPKSSQADDALLAIESIYQAAGNPQGYFDYIENIGKGGTKSESDREDMFFNSAEQVFLSGNYEKALASLQDYLKKYPSGDKTSDANFYMAESYRELGQKEAACDCYKKVINAGSESYAEIATLNYADISYSLQRYEDAMDAYNDLRAKSKFDSNRFIGLKGVMRSAFKAKKYQEAIDASSSLESDKKCTADLKQEAQYIAAKSYLATSRRTQALALFKILSSKPSTAEGAEATYMLVQDAFDRGDFSSVESLTYAFSDSGTGQMYWLAKSFIVLGDSFAEREDMAQAEATFRSILDGYTPKDGSDDVIENVKMRLDRIEQMKK